MKKDLLYAPWRDGYINRNREEKDKNKIKNDCVFCHQLTLNQDEKYLILKRFNNCFVMMNMYPYNVGHLMVLPNDHKGDIRDISKKTRNEIFEVTTVATTALENAVNAKGFNIGINMGIAGGGGIPSHLHVHILPRWIGDTNFCETIGNVKILSADIKKVYKKLKAEFDKI
ncbi:MAG: HIT domain-containing protein [bacterium]